MKKIRTFYIFIVAIMFSFDCFSDEQCLSYYDEEMNKTVYLVPYLMAQHPEGDAAHLKYLSESLRGESIKKEEFPSKIGLSFIVDDDGTIHNIKVVKSNRTDYGCLNERYEYKSEEEYTSFDKKLVEALKSMPNWKAAVYDDGNVASLVLVPLRLDPPR